MKDNEAKQSLIKYLQESKDERLWQAIRNWSGYSFILVADSYAENDISFNPETIEDTFYKEGK